LPSRGCVRKTRDCACKSATDVNGSGKARVNSAYVFEVAGIHACTWGRERAAERLAKCYSFTACLAIGRSTCRAEELTVPQWYTPTPLPNALEFTAGPADKCARAEAKCRRMMAWEEASAGDGRSARACRDSRRKRAGERERAMLYGSPSRLKARRLKAPPCVARS
jgi:hypothetical protein